MSNRLTFDLQEVPPREGLLKSQDKPTSPITTVLALQSPVNVNPPLIAARTKHSRISADPTTRVASGENPTPRTYPPLNAALPPESIPQPVDTHGASQEKETYDIVERLKDKNTVEKAVYGLVPSVSFDKLKERVERTCEFNANYRAQVNSGSLARPDIQQANTAVGAIRVDFLHPMMAYRSPDFPAVPPVQPAFGHTVQQAYGDGHLSCGNEAPINEEGEVLADIVDPGVGKPRHDTDCGPANIV
ncbi:uncharacterized protein PV07_08706 [Cladophialophora immunda]|uniref:Uncharacterized protein n=1 Tax=Cladophialophora immunda TaxID=569365 RepID=A0A0D2C533_9EURO|nr:uncharacterized protein PV07_08706 [Cladophialophora immunda]KIW25540.1 hypothetical protein PV07_08706 [Cladophialophora immunda]